MSPSASVSYDPNSRSALLAVALAEADEELLYSLIEMRRNSGIRQRELAGKLGIAQSSVAAFERHDNDPRLSTIRRYALAVGAVVEHVVRPVGDTFDETKLVASATGTGAVRLAVTSQTSGLSDIADDWKRSLIASAVDSNRTDFALAS
jgi:DNA-binding XRE family transcriptional regulator